MHLHKQNRLHFPPLVISTIVENCIKHGLAQKETLKISLRNETEGVLVSILIQMDTLLKKETDFGK